MAFRPHFEELHIVVLSKKIAEDSIQREDGCIVYHFKRTFFAMRGWYVLDAIKFNLVWRKRFRPDVIVSWGADKSAFLSALLHRRYKKPLFLVLDSHYLELGRFSLRRWVLGLALGRAMAAFVPGEQTAKAYTKAFGVPPAALQVFAPATDMTSLAETRNGFNFHGEHAQYNLFVVSTLYKRHDLLRLFAVHSRVAFKYPRTGFVVLAPKELCKSFEHIALRAKRFGVFFYPLDDSYLSYIKGANLYLGIGMVEDVDKGILAALAGGVPVVTEPIGIARELFADPQFSQFAVSDGSADSLASVLLMLIERQQLRTQYALTTNLLFSKVHSITPEAYAGNMYAIIDEMVQPTLVDPMKDMVQGIDTKKTDGQ
jgi:glycosyltransferase involved in cell wall biosynthesis